MHPKGPLPARVYWRRRITVLAILAAIILVVAIIVWPRGGEATPGAGGTPDPTDTSLITPVPTDTGGPCDPAKVSITPVTDKDTYDSGELPQIWMTVENKSASACTIQFGTDVQRLWITSGDEPYWQSSDCQVDPQPYVQTLLPGVPVETPHISWDRTRSSTESCDAQGEPQVSADGASYHLHAAAGDIGTDVTKQFLLY